MNNDKLNETAAKGVEALSMVLQERNALVNSTLRCEAENAMMRSTIDQLKVTLATLSAERDHYMRYSVELVARLNSVQILINEVVRDSKNAAFRKNGAAPRESEQALSPTETERLQRLVKTIAPEKPKEKTDVAT